MPLNLDPYGGNNLDGMFLLFYKQVAQERVPKLVVVFRYLVKGLVFRHAGDPLLSNVFEEIVARKLGSFFWKVIVCFLFSLLV